MLAHGQFVSVYSSDMMQSPCLCNGSSSVASSLILLFNMEQSNLEFWLCLHFKIISWGFLNFLLYHVMKFKAQHMGRTMIAWSLMYVSS